MPCLWIAISVVAYGPDVLRGECVGRSQNRVGVNLGQDGQAPRGTIPMQNNRLFIIAVIDPVFADSPDIVRGCGCYAP